MQLLINRDTVDYDKVPEGISEWDDVFYEEKAPKEMESVRLDLSEDKSQFILNIPDQVSSVVEPYIRTIFGEAVTAA